ncbi:MAG: type II toxin-antitoxin system HicA family toxin [Patescibacteria group bacterium]
MAIQANISGKQAVKAFLKIGYRHAHTSVDHAILRKVNAPTLSIPLHREISPFLLKNQIKKSGTKVSDFIKLLK